LIPLPSNIQDKIPAFHQPDNPEKMKKAGLTQNQIIFAILCTVIHIAASMSLHAQSKVAMLKQWGEFGDAPGQFKYPAMIALDHSGNVYVVDQHNHRIQKFDPEGNFLLMWGKNGTGPGEFNYPYGIAIDSKGEVYVSDMNNHRIQKFSSRGEFIRSAGSYGTENGQLKYPYGIALDEKDVLYVIDAFNYRIQKFNSDLEFLSAWGSEEEIGIRLYMPHELAIAGDGNVILSDRQNHRISVFSKDGILVKRLGRYGEGKEAEGGQFSEPHGVAVSHNGDIFVCDRYNFRIQKLNADGIFQSAWMSSGILDDSKHFPMGIAVSSDGMVYVVDHYAHCIQKYRP
jgi:tripartite motif-containing protein 71